MTEVEIRGLRDDDVPSLVRMWNSTEDLWPGGFTSGMPLTVDRVLRWHHSTDFIRPVAAFVGGEVVGFCGLTRVPGEPDAAYISILGVGPDVIGQGVGRTLVLAAIDLATNLGFRRLDLDTWSANDRALPLYKRTGFHWVPGTSVNMQNFIPALLRHPLVQRFLNDTDWYQALRPNITFTEDLFEEGNIPVFPYVFERADDRLALALAVGSGEVVAYEDGEVAVTAALARPFLVVGQPGLARWQVHRKNGAAEPFTFSALGQGGIAAGKSLVADAAEAATLEVPVLAPDLPEAGADGKPKVTAILALGNTILELGVPLRVAPPVELSAEPKQVSLAPGVAGTFWVTTKSNLESALNLRLQLTASPHLQVRPLTSLILELAGGASSTVCLEARAEPGVHSLVVLPELPSSRAGTWDPAPHRLTVPVVAVGPGDAFVSRTAEGALLENATLRALVSARGGSLRVQTKNPTQDLVEQRSAVGPPFWPGEFAHRRFDLEIESTEGKATVRLRADSDRWPGLALVYDITVTASPRLETTYTLVNTSSSPLAPSVRVEHMMRLHSSLVAVPLSEGLLVDSAEAAEWEGGGSEPECYAETWAALARDELTVGFLWPAGSRPEFSRRFGPSFTLPPTPLQPGETLPAGRLVLFAGAGGWPTVRQQWRQLFDPAAPPRAPRPLRAADVRVRPDPVVWTGSPVDTGLNLRHLRQRSLAGNMSLSLPSSWQATESEWRFAELRRGRAATFRTTISPAHGAWGEYPPADEAVLNLHTNLAIARQPLALLALGQGNGQVAIREVARHGRKVLEIDNGWTRVAVAPDFAGTVVGFEHAGRNHLFSAFPEPGALMWQRPWFGGIGPVVASAGEHFHPIHSGHLHEEQVTAQHPVGRALLGAVWQGIRLVANLKRPKGIRLETEYLTLTGSNALLAVVRLSNLTTAPQRLQTFLGCYLRVDGDLTGTALRYIADGEHNTRRAAYDVWLAPSADWAALENEKSGLTAALISLTPWAYIQAYNLGLDGAHLFNVGEVLLAPSSSEEYSTLFILTDSPDKARRYRALGWSGSIGTPPEH